MVDFNLPLEPGRFYVEGSETITLFKKGKAKRKAKQPPETETEPGADGFARTKTKLIAPNNPQNIKLAIVSQGIGLKQNEFSNQTEIEGLPPFGPELTDAAAIRLRILIHEKLGFLPDDMLFQKVLIDMAFGNRFHPVRDYLASLKWDGMKRIDNWLCKYGGADDTEFNRAVGRLWLIAAVRRVRQPGCKFDTMPIFESPEGKNKSTALSIMAVRDEWFSDCLVLGADPKEVIEQASGIWIFEIAELTGISKSDISKIKSFTSRRVDRARMAYGRNRENVPRQNVCAGTINEVEYLSEGDNRRFWPVRITQFDLVALGQDRDQLWAEAARCEADGESIVLDENLWQIAADVRAARKIGNPLAEVLALKLRGLNGWIRSTTAWDILNVPLERRTSLMKQFGQALRALGFEKERERALTGGKVDCGDYYYARGNEAERESEIPATCTPLSSPSHAEEITRDDTPF